MFGTKKKLQEAEMYGITATREVYRRKALEYFDIQVKNMYGKGALTWLRGGLQVAQELGILTATEIDRIDKIGSANFDAILKAEKEEKARVIAQHQAERIAKAKAAKGE